MINKTNINSIPNEPGLYFLFNENKEIVYIGVSRHLRNRIKSHKKDKDFKYIRYSIINDTGFLFKREKRLIHELRPKYNNKSIYYECRQRPFIIGMFYNLDKISKKYIEKINKFNDPNSMRFLVEDEDEPSQ